MKTAFKEKDPVFHICFGLGVVQEIDINIHYPIKVDFNGRPEVFTLEGKYFESDKYPSLSFTDYSEFISQDRNDIEPIFKEGDLVWMKGNNSSSSSSWYAGIYSRKVGEYHLASMNGSSKILRWNEIRPIDERPF